MSWATLLLSFRGRISPRAFWKYQIALTAISLLVVIVSPQPEIALGMGAAELFSAAMAATPWWHWPVMAAMLYTGLAVATKRWHDQDRSAVWNLLLLAFPFGALVMIGMLGFIAGSDGPNRYGPAPID
jgi:uncharacterized membrane protein YhaH (DUF805 family)